MPKFDKTFCSQCGGEFGPGDHGYSHCDDHPPQTDHDDEINEAIYDAVCDGEGRATARYLRRHLERHGLKIVPVTESAGAWSESLS